MNRVLKSDITKGELRRSLQGISPTTEFSFVLKNKFERISSDEEVISRILDDVSYQEQIAISVDQLSEELSGLGLRTYYWEMGKESLGWFLPFEVYSISLVLEPNNQEWGRILFPVRVAQTSKGRYYYQEIIDKVDALVAVKSLWRPMPL